MTGLTMRSRQFLPALLVVAAVGAFGSVASAAPPEPSYRSSCAVGGNTTLSWKHKKNVAAVRFAFYTPAWGYIGSSDVSVPTTKRPNGQAGITTPSLAGHYSVAVRTVGDATFYSVAQNLDCS
jgi:hypothetical protein